MDGQQTPCPNSTGLDGERVKRQKTEPLDGGIQNIAVLGYMMDKMSYELEKEQKKREMVENKLKEAELQKKLLEHGRAIKKEVSAKYETILQSKDKEIAGLREDMAKVKEENKEIVELRKDIGEATTIIWNRDTEIVKLKGKIDTIEETNDAKDKEITALSFKCDLLNEKYAQQTKEVELKERIVEALQSLNKVLEKKNEQLELELSKH
jgi:chromosome segregation ATPase